MENITKKQRLLSFGHYLDTISKPLELIPATVWLMELEQKVRISYEVKYNLALLQLLPLAFAGEWYFHEDTGLPLLKNKTLEYGTMSCFATWFEVSPEEICHLLDIEGFQSIDRYCGKILNEYSEPQDYALNFKELAANC